MLRPRSRPALGSAGLVLALLLVAAALVVLARPGGGLAAETASPKDTERFANGSCAKTAVRFGIVLADDDAEGKAAADRLTSDLAEGLGCRAITVAYPTQAQLLTAIAMHDVDIAQVDASASIVASRATGASPAGAYAVDEDTPARTRPTGIWVRENSRIRALGDLRGVKIAFGPRLTSGGDIDPRAALLAAGVKAGDDVASFEPDDAGTLAALRDRSVDAAVTRGTDSDSAVRGLRRVWTGTAPLADVVMLRPGIPKAVRRLIQVAVRGLPGAALAPLAARQGVSEPAPLANVPLDLYAPLATRLDDLVAAGLTP